MIPACLVAGEALPDREVWLRELTNRDFLKRDGTVHRQALKAPAIGSSEGRDWSHELSGRARSAAGDIEAHACVSVERARAGFESRGLPVPSKVTFVGVAYAAASQLRKSEDLKLDAIYTPNNDTAHSDFVIYNGQDVQVEQVIEFLQKTLKTAPSGNLKPLYDEGTSRGVEG